MTLLDIELPHKRLRLNFLSQWYDNPRGLAPHLNPLRYHLNTSLPIVIIHKSFLLCLSELLNLSRPFLIGFLLKLLRGLHDWVSDNLLFKNGVGLPLEFPLYLLDFDDVALFVL
jgi:hypothetical protein